MWEMMLPYFESLEQEEALRQFNEQFPNGIEETPASELIADYNEFCGNLRRMALECIFLGSREGKRYAKD
jgi:hypothetical protein